MFILILRTCTIAGALQVGGTTLQVADSFVLNDNVRQVAAPIVPPVVGAPAVAGLAPVEGSVRALVNIQQNGSAHEAGKVFPPGTLLSTTRSISKSGNGQSGRDEFLYQVFKNGQWVTSGFGDKD